MESKPELIDILIYLDSATSAEVDRFLAAMKNQQSQHNAKPVQTS